MIEAEDEPDFGKLEMARQRLGDAGQEFVGDEMGLVGGAMGRVDVLEAVGGELRLDDEPGPDVM